MTTAYRLAPGVRWIVNRATITVTDGNEHTYTLRYPEAAVWDLLTRAYPFAKIVSMTGYIASLDPTEAETVVRTSLHTWGRHGLLEPAVSTVIPMRSV